MRKLGLSLLGAAGLLAAAAIGPANATVEPNGSLSVTINGPNTVVPSGDISAATTVLNLTGTELLGSFVDPFLTNPNNFCSTAGGGCSAAHTPGYLAVGDVVTQSAMGFTVFTPGSGTHPFVDNVTITAADGNSVDFDFTSIFTSTLVPTTTTVSGQLSLDLLGTFASDTAGVYTLGQSASMSIQWPDHARRLDQLLEVDQHAVDDYTSGRPRAGLSTPSSALLSSALARSAAAAAMSRVSEAS